MSDSEGADKKRQQEEKEESDSDNAESFAPVSKKKKLNKSSDDEDAPKAKSKGKTFGIDDEAEDSDEQEDEDDDNDALNDGEDDFIDADEGKDGGGDDEEEEEDEDDDDKYLTKLKRTKAQVILDDEDEQLIQEHIEGKIQEEQAKKKAASSNEDEEIAPIAVQDEYEEGGRNRGKQMLYDDDEEDDGMGDFIVDEDGDGGEGEDEDEDGVPKERAPAPQPARRREKRDGPTIDQMQEAIDIFGEGYDFDDDEEDLGEEEGSDVDEDEGPEGDLSAKERKNISLLRSKYERSQLVAAFCTDRDDELRIEDRPERYMELPALAPERNVHDDVERNREAKWMTAKLVDRIIAERRSEDRGLNLDLSKAVQASLNYILKFILVDQHEIPFIWTYRKDYLHESILRSHLWHILTLHQEWLTLNLMKLRLRLEIETLDDAAAAVDSLSPSDMLSEQVNEMYKQIKTLSNTLNALQVDVEEAEEFEKRAEDIIEEKDDDCTEEDRERVRKAKENLEDLREKLNTTQQELDRKREDAERVSQRISRMTRYRPEAAKEVLRLFPIERYDPQIESAKELDELKVISKFLFTLAKGAEAVEPTKHINAISGEEMEVEGDGIQQAADKIGVGRIGSSKKDEYARYKGVPWLRTFVEKMALPVYEFGDAMRLGIVKTQPATPAETPEQLAERMLASDEAEGAGILRSPDHVKHATSVLLATEMSLEPTIRKEAARVFKKNAKVSTSVTKKGLLAINPFHEFYGIHRLEGKPLSEFYNGFDRGLLPRLVDAENQGLITVSIKLPQVNNDDGTTESDINDFMAPGSELGLLSYFMPAKQFSEETYEESRGEWDAIRLNTLEVCLNKYLIPSFETEFRRDLLRIGREYIIEQTANAFEKRLKVGPFRPSQDPREATRLLLRSCPDRPPPIPSVASIYMSNAPKQPVFLAYVNKDGVLRAHEIIPSEVVAQSREKFQNTIKQFLLQNKPDLVIVNSGAGAVARSTLLTLEKNIIPEIRNALEEEDRTRKELMRQQRNSYDDEYEDEEEAEFTPFTCEALIVQDDVAKIFKESARAKKQFPDLELAGGAGVCLARYVQEPIIEFCNMWTTANESEVFGFELLHLKLHPNQGLLKGSKKQLLRALECKLVDAVCDIGIDINKAVALDHVSPMLAFVCGLGLRKADALKQNIRRSLGTIDSRKVLLVKKLMGKVVWTNAAGFLRVRDSGQGKMLDPLDNTRIHPECYMTHDFAPKICADALEVENTPNDYIDTVDRLMKTVRKELDKRMKKHPKWVDLWEHGQRPIPGVTEFNEKIKTTDGQEHDLGIELNDSLSQLLLEDYATDLEEQGKGKRKLQLEHIKDELRFPWLDLRQPITTLPANEMFSLITGENDQSLYVGLQLGCHVLEVVDNTYFDESKGSSIRRQRAVVRTETGLRGTINMYDVVDGNIDPDFFNLSEYVSVGQNLLAVVVNINKERIQIDLSIKPTFLQRNEAYWMRVRSTDRHAKQWWLQTVGSDPEYLFDPHFKEQSALSDYEKADNDQRKQSNSIMNSQIKSLPMNDNSAAASIGGKNMRLIHHPLFANLCFEKGEARLKSQGKGAGEVLIRPSSKGPNFLTITWAFQDGWFKHISIEERGKKTGDLGLGSELYIMEPDICEEPYSDLDELYSRYIEPMNDYVNDMTNHKTFLKGTVEEVEAVMKEQQVKEPSRIPYSIRFEPTMPGAFVLTWLSSNPKNPVRKALIKVRPSGYLYDGQVFGRPSDLIVTFKKKADEAGRKTSNGPDKSAQPGLPGNRPRKSRFSSGSSATASMTSNGSQHMPPCPAQEIVPLPPYSVPPPAPPPQYSGEGYN